MTCTDRAAEIRRGDRFEITVEAHTPFAQNSWKCDVQGTTLGFLFDTTTLLAGRRVARPLAVGDRVRGKAIPRVTGELVGVRGQCAFVDWEYPPGNGGIPGAKVFLDHIERAPAPDTKEGTA